MTSTNGCSLLYSRRLLGAASYSAAGHIAATSMINDGKAASTVLYPENTTHLPNVGFTDIYQPLNLID